MSEFITSNYNLLKLYAKHYELNFKQNGVEFDFCKSMCADCKIRKKCDDQTSVARPTITVDEMQRFKQEYPEYII